MRLNHERTCSRVGDVLLSSSTFADMMKPGVQTPHWAPPCAIQAICSGCRLSAVPMPSIVVIFAPGASFSIVVWQARSGLPSTITVHEPHWPSSQQTLQPVSNICSRKTSARVAVFSATTQRSTPFTFSSVRFMSSLLQSFDAPATTRPPLPTGEGLISGAASRPPDFVCEILRSVAAATSRMLRIAGRAASDLRIVATISATTEMAISSGVTAPMSKPTGA